jgi:hypothetical protein
MLADNIYPNRTGNINFSSEYIGRSGRLKSSPEEYDYISNMADFYDIEREASNTDFVLSNVDGYAEKIKLSNPIGTNWCFVNVVIQILLHLEDLWLATLIKFGRDGIRTKIREEYSKFACIGPEEQCDATLLLNWLLDRLGDFRESWSIDWSYNYRCKSCGHKTNKKVSDNIWYIYPNESGHYIDDHTGNVFRYDLGNCTQSQTKGTLTKQCEQCGGTKEHIYTNYIDKYPKNIFMNLQQFEDQSIYIFDCIELRNGNSKKYIEYDLMGFVVHSGTNNFGHYKIYLQDNIGWRCYDDENITYIDIDEVLNIQDKDSMDTIPLLWYQFSKDNNDSDKKQNTNSETVVNGTSQYSFAFEYNSPETDEEPEPLGYGYNSLDLS